MMSRSLKKSLITIFAAGAILLLFGGVAWAAWKRGADWEFNAVSICEDRITFGFGDSLTDFAEYEFIFYADSGGTLQEIGRVTKVKVDDFIDLDAGQASEFCSGFQAADPPIKICGGVWFLRWNQDLSLNTPIKAVMKGDGSDLTNAGEGNEYDVGQVGDCLPPVFLPIVVK
jgi:hypothetical protein